MSRVMAPQVLRRPAEEGEAGDRVAEFGDRPLSASRENLSVTRGCLEALLEHDFRWIS